MKTINELQDEVIEEFSETGKSYSRQRAMRLS